MSWFINDGLLLENIAILNAKGATFSGNEGLRILNSSMLENKGVI